MPLLWTVMLFAPTALGALWLAPRLTGPSGGLIRTLATIVLVWAWITLGLQILGVAGHLHRLPLLAWSLAGLGLGVIGARGAPPQTHDSVATRATPSAPGGHGWDWPGTLALGLALWASLLTGLPSLLLPVKVVSDGPIYHLHFAARWWQEGRLSLIAAPFGETAATYFPANGDLWFAGLIVAWGGDRLARIGQAPFLLAAAVAAFALARRLGARPGSALIATAWFVTCTPLLLFSFEANVDTLFVAGYLLAVVFLQRYALDQATLGNLVLAGLAAGAAWGCKPTATVFVPVLLLLGTAVVLRRPVSRSTQVAHLAGFALASLGLAAYWFGRNALLTGNPLYPAHVSVLGRTLLPGWFPTSAMRWSQFYIPIEYWQALLDILITVFDPRELPFWTAAALGWGAWRSRGPEQRRWLRVCTALALLNIALYWLVIPYRTQQRFMSQALGLLVPGLAAVFDRGRWLRWLATGVLLVHLTTGQAWPVPIQFSGVIPAPPQGAISLPWSLDQWRATLSRDATAAYLLVKLLLGVTALAVAWLWTRAACLARPRLWSAAMSALLLQVGIGVLAVDQILGQSRGLFPAFPEYYQAWNRLERATPPGGARIAYAGTNLPYYLMGSDLRNWVGYVNIDRQRDWLMHDYHRTARERGEPVLWETPRPGWDRIRPDREAWLANLAASQIDYLVVARANPIDGPFNLAPGDPEQFPIERRWADERPDRFRPIYGQYPPDPQMRIYQVLPIPKNARIAAVRAPTTE